MKIRIVSYEDVKGWILGKFALNLEKHLKEMGHDVDIAKVPDPTADINHHIIFLDYKIDQITNSDTLMITHIDDVTKLSLVKNKLRFASAGICMSKETMNNLIKAGISNDKLFYVNPAHDGIFVPRKIVIGITSKMHPDGRKREGLLLEVAKYITPKLFKLKIMGEGWERIVVELRRLGFEVEYLEKFDYQMYISFVPSLDYYLYMGQDEGSMGFVDALAAGVETIVTKQGYHLDAPNGLVYGFDSKEELIEIFKNIENKKQVLINSVSTWTWGDYAIKHLEIWEYLFSKNRASSKYIDGLNSNLNSTKLNKYDKILYEINLYKIMFSRFFYSIDKAGKIKRRLKRLLK
ncbi:MAG: glycosyltransferase [Chloroflexia bacterium]|nr:glycosyltransferase [Chloroflexia bacterium]